MKLSDIFLSLASGELSTLNYVSDGGIDPEKYNVVVNAINRAITSLGTKFVLKKGYFTLETRPDQNIYYLKPEFSQSSGDPDYYIDDSELPFTEPLLEILSITTTDKKVLALDGTDNVVRLNVNALKFLSAEKESAYLVHYSILPTLNNLDYGNEFNPEDIEIDIPLAYLNAIVYFVASVFYRPTLSGLDGVRANQDMNYRQMYEAECLLLDSKGIDVDETEPTNLFNQRGFI